MTLFYPEKDVALLQGSNGIVNKDKSDFGLINDQAQPEVDIDLLPGVPGQRGPQGPPGADGVQPADLPALIAYRHVQSSAAYTWTINHNLDFYPSVTVFDSGGSLVEGDINVSLTNPQTLTVQFSTEISGFATLS